MLATLLITTAAASYEIRRTESGALVSWQGEAIRLRFDASLSALGPTDQIEAMLIEALDTWEGSGYLPMGFQVELGEGALAGYHYDQPNSNDIMASTGPWPYGADETAVTILTYDSNTGQLIDADIVFDASRSWSNTDLPLTDRVDLLDTATHELGHLLGLEHSEYEEATMYEVGPLGSTERRTLHDDDIEAMLAIYGPPPILGRHPEVGCSTVGAPKETTGYLVALMIFVAVLRRRRS